MRYAFLLGFFLLLASCSRTEKPLLPEGMSKDSVISRDRMVLILTDIHVLEAVLQYQRNRKGQSLDPVTARYQQLFSEYGISRKRFTQNLAYYQSDPEEFLKIYNDVVSELEKRKKLLKLH